MTSTPAPTAGRADSCNVLEVREPGDVLNLDDEPEYIEIEVAYDTGCGAHVADRADLPGHEVRESEGSRRGREFLAAGGTGIPDEGEVEVHLIADSGDGKDQEITSIFNVAAVTRPLWSVSKILDKLGDGAEAVFKRHTGEIRDGQGRVLATFTRRGGLYVGVMKMKNPKFQGFPRPAR